MTVGKSVNQAGEKRGGDLSAAWDLPRRERYRLLADLPAFVTFPRVGSQWLEAVMERYFDRPCLRERRATLIQDDREDWLFFHDHDRKLELVHSDVLYLYRAPVETVYSFLIYRFTASRRKSWWGRWRQRGEQAITPAKVEAAANAYRTHLEKWLLSPHRARTAVRYERLQSHPNEEFSQICDHFGLAFDPDRLARTLEEASRSKMVEIAVKKKALNASLLSEDYKTERRNFERDYGSRVREIVITPPLAAHFTYLETTA